MPLNVSSDVRKRTGGLPPGLRFPSFVRCNGTCLRKWLQLLERRYFFLILHPELSEQVSPPESEFRWVLLCHKAFSGRRQAQALRKEIEYTLPTDEWPLLLYPLRFTWCLRSFVLRNVPAFSEILDV